MVKVLFERFFGAVHSWNGRNNGKWQLAYFDAAFMCSSGEYNFVVVVKHWSELVSLLSKKKIIIRYQKIFLILYNVEIENCFWFIGEQFFQGFVLVRFVIERFPHIIKVCHPHIRLFQGIFFLFFKYQCLIQILLNFGNNSAFLFDVLVLLHSVMTCYL